MPERWLKCEIRKGMFSDERVVVIQTRTGDVVAFFVPAERVSESAGQAGRVKVRVWQENAHAWAIVPNENQTLVPVDESQFVAA